MHILLVEDYVVSATLIREMLLSELQQLQILQLTHVTSLASAFEHLDQHTFDAILLDIELPDSSGISTVHRLVQRAPQTPIVVLTSESDEQFDLEAMRAGAQDFLLKGNCTHEVLNRVIRYAIERKTLQIEQRRMEMALLHSEMEFRALFEKAPFGIYRSREDSDHFLAVNSALVKMLGYNSAEELMGASLNQDVYKNPDDRKKIWEALPQSAVDLEVEWKRKDGALIIVRLLADRLKRNPPGLAHGQYEVMVEDITARRELEEHLRQVQRLESIGRLAGGVAHDFNNMLMVIASYAQILNDKLAATPELKTHVEEILKASERAAETTRQLLAFSRKQVLSPKLINLNDTLGETLALISKLIGEDIKLVFDPAGELWNISADPGQMVQVIVNLAVNARDAMPKGGLLNIETTNIMYRGTDTTVRPQMKNGEYVLMTVSDTGCGMSPEVQAHAFEPFYTTKPVGKGTGLGLATVYGIIKQSGGYIWIDSELERGATIKIYLPRSTKAAATPECKPRTVRKGSGTLLLVEDEPATRKCIAEFLAKAGYEVIEAGSGPEALVKGQKLIDKIDLVISDVVMPEMSGKELVENLQVVNPQLKVLYMSGYTEEAIKDHGTFYPGMNFLQKPFDLRQLVEKVGQILLHPRGEEEEAYEILCRP